MTREETRKRLATETFDIVIVGGGINGAGIARDAALRGYSVALLEQDDFAFGTSSRSSKLIHGGLRYLEQYEFGLVFESVSERYVLSRVARHLVRPLPFIFPAYKEQGFKRSRFAMTIGLWMYDTLALFRNYKNHRSMSAKKVAQLIPGLRPDSLRGGVHYYDYQTNDSRLVVENVLAARDLGAALLNYARVESFHLGGEQGQTLQVRCQQTGETFEVRGRAIVSASGPWTDLVTSLTGDHRHWLSPTKGIHLVLPKDKLPLDRALALFHPDDGRVHFVLPFFERMCVGTTDTFYEGDPGKVAATAEDVRYLLRSINHHFPAARIVATDVVSTWAGLRPLVNEGGSEAGGPSDVSREHHIETWKDGLVVIAGGKLTTYRLMSSECVDVAAEVVAKAGGPAPKKAVNTSALPLPGAVGLESDDDLDALTEKVAGVIGNAESARHLAESYGTRVEGILDIVRKHPETAERLADDIPFIWAEVDFCATTEMCCRLRDVLIRRMDVLYRDRDQGLLAAEQAARRMAPILGWDEAQIRAQVDEYHAVVKGNRAWREAFGRPEEVRPAAD